MVKRCVLIFKGFMVGNYVSYVNNKNKCCLFFNL